MTYDDEQIRNRILLLMHREGLSQVAFAAKIGRNQSNVSDIMRGKRNVPKGFIDDILNFFPNVSKDWLMFGEGTMSGDSIPADEKTRDTRPRLPKTMAEPNIEDFLAGPGRKLCQEKPVVTQFADYEFTLILKNDRMTPKYQRGDELAFRKSSIIEWGNDYLLDTAEGPKFKKVYNNEKAGSVRCVSYNKKDYPDFDIPKDKIYGYYKCVGVIRVL